MAATLINDKNALFGNPREQLPECFQRIRLMGVYTGSQADRNHVSDRRDRRVIVGGSIRIGIADSSVDSQLRRRRVALGRSLQSDVYAARGRHGLCVHYSQYSGSTGQLCATDDARSQRCRLSQIKLGEFLSLDDWNRLFVGGDIGRRRAGYRLDLLHSLQH